MLISLFRSLHLSGNASTSVITVPVTGFRMRHSTFIECLFFGCGNRFVGLRAACDVNGRPRSL
jgi:hypothetical protein